MATGTQCAVLDPRVEAEALVALRPSLAQNGRHDQEQSCTCSVCPRVSDGSPCQAVGIFFPMTQSMILTRLRTTASQDLTKPYVRHTLWCSCHRGPTLGTKDWVSFAFQTSFKLELMFKMHVKSPFLINTHKEPLGMDSCCRYSHQPQQH